MVSAVSIVVGNAILYSIYSTVSGFQKNLAAAKRSGLPYIITRKGSPALLLSISERRLQVLRYFG